MQKALQSCRDALGLAMRIGYAWLQAMASNTLSELAFAAQDTAEAIRAGEQALAVARRMGARRLQSAAHRALARLIKRYHEAAARTVLVAAAGTPLPDGVLVRRQPKSKTLDGWTI